MFEKTTKTLINRCTLPSPCKKQWAELEIIGTDTPDQRHCSECKQTIYRIHSHEDLEHHTELGNCVAFVYQVEKLKKPIKAHWVGRPARPNPESQKRDLSDVDIKIPDFLIRQAKDTDD